tara:strand:- start:75 stop:1079 length:1005 start_codon:yes stop_codon:yes gene_type:complete
MKNKLKIIAEIAQGFEGNFTQSKLLISAAAKSGADAVKFQLVYADELATADYQYYSLFKNLEMSEMQWKDLSDYAISLGSKLIVDVFGEKSLETAENIGIDTVKVHGTDVTNLGLLESISSSSIKMVILGLGGAHWKEIENALKIFNSKSLVLLCGFQGYPTKTVDNHIARMNVIKEKAKSIHTDFEMGFADHPKENQYSSTISLVAIGAGASIIEKHLTLGKVMEMEDFESALNPDEFQHFVTQLKTGKKALGQFTENDDFGMSEAERTYRENVRRDVVAKKKITKGETLNVQNTTLKRTEQVNTIKQLELVLGRTAKNVIQKNQSIERKDIN